MLSLVATWNILFGDGVTDSYSCYTMIKGTSSMGEGELVSYKPTENVAYIRSNITPHKVTAGQEYRWIAIGGIE